MKSNEIFTVASIDVMPDDPIDLYVVGSHQDRTAAVRECVDYMMERIELRDDLRYALMHDEQHEEMLDEIAERSNMNKKYVLDLFAASEFRVSPDYALPEALKPALESYFSEKLLMESEYFVETSPDSDIGAVQFMFRIIANPLLAGEERSES